MNILGTCTSAIAQLHAKIADQDTKIAYIIQAIGEINGKFDKICNYLTQSTTSSPNILSPPLPKYDPPLPVQTPSPPSSSSTPTPEIWPQLYCYPPVPLRRGSILKRVENQPDLDYLEQVLSSDLQFRQDVVSFNNVSSTLIHSLLLNFCSLLD